MTDEERDGSADRAPDLAGGPEPAHDPQPRVEAEPAIDPEPATEPEPSVTPTAEPAEELDSATGPEPAMGAGAGDASTDPAGIAEAPRVPSDPAEQPSPRPAPPEPPESPESPEASLSPEPPAPPVMVRRSISEEIARRLHAAGARYCFTVPAEPILPLLDALANAGIRVVTTRHEGSAAFMAQALAQSTGRPQVVAVSRGVGAANAAIGIHAASQDSVPLVALIGGVSTAFAGREAFQEADIAGGPGSWATWSGQIDAADQAGSILDAAWMRLTTGRPGPVVLSVPADLQSAVIEMPDAQVLKPPGARGGAADRSAVRRALKMLAASERGVIVAGGGVLQSRSTKRLVALSEALAVPVIASWRRPDVFPNDHANYLGMAGPWVAPTVPRRLADADVILFVGTRLSEPTTDGYHIPGPDTQWIQVDIQPRVAGKGLAAPSLSIAADATRFLDTAWSDLRAAALDNEMRSRREARNAADREAYKAASEVGQGAWRGPGVHPGRIVAMLRAALPDNAIITSDAGNLAAFVARGFRFRRAGTFIGTTSGSMGFGLPAAIAASLMDPDRIAVAVCGDGGFAMTAPELETAVRVGAHPIAIVLDNQRYGTIALKEAEAGDSTSLTDLGAIDFAAAARAHGALGFSVSEDAAFGPVLHEAISSRQTSVIHVSVDRGWRSVDDNPMVLPAKA